MFSAPPTVRWSPSARRWPRRRKASTVCGGGPSPAVCPGAPPTSGSRWRGCEVCRRRSGSASTAGVWEPWPPGGLSDASVLRTKKKALSLSYSLCLRFFSLVVAPYLVNDFGLEGGNQASVVEDGELLVHLMKGWRRLEKMRVNSSEGPHFILACCASISLFFPTLSGSSLTSKKMVSWCVMHSSTASCSVGTFSPLYVSLLEGEGFFFFSLMETRFRDTTGTQLDWCSHSSETYQRQCGD